MAEPGAAPPLAPSQRPPVGKGKARTVNIPADKFAPVLGLGFGMIARMRGPHWALTEQELAGLSVAIADIAVYIPLPETELGIALALSNLATSLFIVVWPRIEEDAALNAQRHGVAEAERALREAQSGTPGSTEGMEGPRNW